jgi:Tol biopolymer transport system component
LGGTLALSNAAAPDYIYRVMTVNLHNANPQILAKGDNPALSPDSRQILFSSGTGLQRMELKSGIVTPLEDTGKNDRSPIWSPDGSKIAFTRGPASGLIGAPGPYNIIIANPDGTQQIPVVENGDANIVMAWFPDGQDLLYTVAGPDGSSVTRINIATGQVTHLFDTNYVNSGVALSPDGKQVAYEVMLLGGQYGINASDVDGQNQKLISDAAPIVVTVPHWSPDGNWLIVSVHDESFLEIPVLVLIEVDTCQIIPLTTISGYVSTWNP